ncbi:MAG: SMC-Scp complex subunit ScpB [Planctomycetaceae bacterium]|nr:SMC-Scp complex subunit ScpB [Planctomycetaceae bacterium]
MTVRSTDDAFAAESSDDRTFWSEADTMSVDDIEAAYARAMEAVDAVEHAVPELAWSESPENSVTGDDRAHATPGAPPGSLISTEGGAIEKESGGAAEISSSGREQLLQPQQVLEAALFVGGEPLPAKRLAHLLHRDSDTESVEELITGLNQQYVEESRPYEIVLREGGYELTLRPEFERIRDRVYGRNSKEVKLTQEALEVLALVAYRQPIACQEIVDAGKANAAAILRQLLRRELVRLMRSEGSSGEVTYATTPRFLELFGLRHLDELPFPDDMAIK